jgi:hypothetical protein
MGIDSTGIELYLVATSTDLTDKADCTTAIATGKKIAKVKSLGAIGGSRTVSETKYLSNDDSEKSLGTISYGNITINTPFNPTDNEGQGELRTMYDDKSERIMLIKNTDGNFTHFRCKCSAAPKEYVLDDFVMFNATIEQNSKETEVTA